MQEQQRHSVPSTKIADPGRALSPKAPPKPTPGALGERALPSDSPLPERKKLPHEIPSWVADGSIYFITINCLPRGHNQLAHPAIASVIEQSLLYYQTAGKWWMHCLLLMPDHLHALITFSRETSMRRLISDWKRFIARQNGIEWQRDFFDHRIRSGESLAGKWYYIRNNPVRKGLVQTPDDWPYQWLYGALDSENSGRAVSPKPPPQNDVGRALSPKAPPKPTPGALGERALPTSLPRLPLKTSHSATGLAFVST